MTPVERDSLIIAVERVKIVKSSLLSQLTELYHDSIYWKLAVSKNGYRLLPYDVDKLNG